MALAASFTLAFPSISLSSRTRISSSGSCYPLRCSIQNSSLSVSVPDTTISKCNETLSAIQNSGIIACLRAESAELAFEAARAALNGGITVLEIVMSNPGVFEVLQQLVHEYPTKIIGVGTVLNLEDAKHAISHGAKFLLSPAMVMVWTEQKGILDDVSCSKALYIPGAMTPTEILSAFSSGAKMIKVYPVSALGGIQYIAALKKPFPHIPLIASQGITVVRRQWVKGILRPFISFHVLQLPRRLKL
ncbi:uncharacterized protein LOC113757196 isoform X4 [Coffea eugenioides]|uniref:Uncharacterized protein isoform X4 n=1 Tax=Coffea arabica TaxID=13443 RepID=A0A6P6T419_COFAR|nr:uncharacterized protein LOC113697359 isoform X4 [Coffea arabica]XP_027156404.1 uncharacterized protein LOC113757196 isoform X4 [Coffea eugenioides]